jgi:membrane-bound serine protease (ClpP class)
MDSELVQVLWSLLTNPNVVYVLLISGLWAAAAALYVPGTGLPEAGAIICLALAIAGLTQLPVSAVGVILIGVAGLLAIIDLKFQSVALTVGAAASLVMGSVFLFPPTEGIPRLSPWLIGIATLASLVFFSVTLSAAIRAQRLHAKGAAEAIIGQRGLVITPLNPVGTVQVQGELWTAVAGESIGVGEEVEVAALEGLRARVARVGLAQQTEQ